MAATDLFAILPEEWVKFDEQFQRLNPVQGIITGDQAKGFFLQTRLPPALLGLIWSLADTNADGKMDRHEFAIAMKLVQMKLKGYDIPPELPPSLKLVTASVGSGANTQAVSALGLGGVGTLPMNAFPPPSQFGASLLNGSGGFSSVISSSIPAAPIVPVDVKTQRSASITSQDSPTGSLQEWAIPHQSKLKYTQIFNTTDRMRSGFLTGSQARNLLVQTGLPQNMLAQIWSLSDLDGDGRLTCEEFLLAMHLSDSVKAGDKLPAALPSDLIPPSFRKLRSGSLTSGNLLVGTTSAISTSPARILLNEAISSDMKDEESKRLAMMTTFEDKRRENFEKGQAELERRRLALVENQRKEREERERKDKEEQERKERIRQEQERRRQLELEKQLAKQRELEQEKEEQRRKALEQREAARREMERQRQLEWEKQRRQELFSQRQKEQEKVLQLKAQNQNLGIELEQLNEKVKEFNRKISDTRNGVTDIKNSIDKMRENRDAKVGQLEMLKKQIKEQNARLIKVNEEKAKLGDSLKMNTVNNPTADAFNLIMNSFSNKQITLKNLRDKLNHIEKDVTQKLADIDSNSSQLSELKKQIQTLLTTAEEQYKDYETKRAIIIGMKPKKTANAVESMVDKFKVSWGDENAKWPVEKTVTSTTVESSGASPWAAADSQEWNDQPAQSSVWDSSDAWASSSDATNWTSSAENAVGSETVKYRVLYAFESRNPDELTIMPGDIVAVHLNQSTEPGWLSGEIKGQVGWFPEAYVEPLVDSSSRSANLIEDQTISSGVSGETVHIVGTEMKMTLTGIQEAPESISDNGSVGGGIEILSSEPPPSAFVQVPKSTMTSSPIPGQGQTVEGLQAQALYPWRAKKENHLSFNKGDIIIIKEQQDVWWFGELENRQGWFPKSYVKLAATEQLQSAANEEEGLGEHVAIYTYQSTEPGDLNFTQGEKIIVTKTEGDWWTGTIGGRSGVFPCNYVKQMDEIQDDLNDTAPLEEPPPEPEIEAPAAMPLKAESPDSFAKREAPEPPATPKTRSGKKAEIATVIAPYAATGQEQLSLQKGQLISIRKKNDSGWWEGELHAKGKKRQVGWFPASYVKVLSSGDSARSTPEPVSTKDDSGRSSKLSSAEMVVVLYPYTAQNDDELTLEKGAFIKVINKEDAAWWKGECNGSEGVFPSNYVRPCDPSADDLPGNRHSYIMHSGDQNLSSSEIKRQASIMELMETEETYMEDMSIVLDAFRKPMEASRLLNELELDTLFVNWNELIQCNTKLLKAFRVRRKMSKNGVITMIGDVLCENLPHMTPYIRFCSCQLNAAAIVQKKTETSQEFRDLAKKCCMDPRTKGMPVSSFLLKPMQRITKYPLLIKKIMELTPESHPDYAQLTEALAKAEELCSQVNEGVREKENSDRLEYVQRTVVCDNLLEKITFNSLTNSLGPRKFLHSGTLTKTKSGKDLMAFLFNDFLLLTQPYKNFGSVSSLFALEKLSSTQFKMYKQPLFLNKMELKKKENGGSDDNVLSFMYGDRMHSYKTANATERNVWIRKLESASAHYRQVEQRKTLRNQSTQLHQRPALGRLLVVVTEGVNLCAKANGQLCVMLEEISLKSPGQQQVRRRPSKGILRVIVVAATNLVLNKLKGRSDPYCEVSMGSQENRTKVVNDTVNPKWNASMQFIVKDVESDILCFTVYDRDYFSPNDFLGRTEIRVSEIHEESQKTMGPIVMRKKLLEVDTGEIVVKLDIQLFK